MRLSLDDIGTAMALGGTYHSHQQETERIYRWPDFWTLPEAAIICEGETIEIPERVEDVKPGAELTAVIGERIHQASVEEAWEAIKGFTISNDVTASGAWPGWSDPEHGMITGVGYKSLATFSPILSDIVPKQDQDHYDDLSVEVLVDGKQSVVGSTEQIAFSIPDMVSFASRIIPLEENDIVALGDPGDPSIMLDNAESVTCSIESIGQLSNDIQTF